FAAGARVSLLESFEDDALLFWRDANAGVGDFKGDYRGGAIEDRVAAGPTDGSDADGEADTAMFGEFEGVGEQVFQDLLETLGVGDQAAHQGRVGDDVEVEAAMLG